MTRRIIAKYGTMSNKLFPAINKVQYSTREGKRNDSHLRYIEKNEKNIKNSKSWRANLYSGRVVLPYRSLGQWEFPVLAVRRGNLTS